MSRPGGGEGSDEDDGAAGTTCHAACLVLGEAGVLIRGPAGAGKSSLCLELIERAAAEGRHALLVGDDRVRLSRHHGRIVARPHPALAGLVEVRGHGLLAVPHLEAAVVRLVCDLVETQARLPEAPTAPARLLGISLPRLVLARGEPRAFLVRRALTGAGTSVSLQTHPALPWAAARPGP